MVIEDYLDGEEASFFALSDGKTVLPLATAQDHKRVGEDDTGPNTGGMGAYLPGPGDDGGAGRARRSPRSCGRRLRLWRRAARPFAASSMPG